MNKEWLKYVLKHTKANLETGKVFWAIPKRGRKWGVPLGCKDTNGYVKMQINNVPCYGHQIIWMHATKKLPPNMLDHVDQNPSNNCITNLRSTNHSKNMLNRPITSSNTTGIRGVYTTAYGKYRTTIAGKYLGTYNTIKEAREAIHENL